jgi:UDP-GlcNAc:undecaprenyl-phosphate/decaprenyl-phosphate GlcNAc-1-phosphate transferase
LNLELFASYGAAAVLIIGFLSLLNPIAESIRLVDHPDGERKQHAGAIPLMGGTALFFTLFIILVLTPLDTNAIGYPTDFWPSVGFLLGVLVLTHAFDDIHAISAVVRLALDGAIGVLLCTIGLLQIDTLGFLFGSAETTMGRWAIPMTVFSFIAASNAFNMTDGIDSLCTGLGIVCFTTIIALLVHGGSTEAEGLVELCVLVIFTLLPLYLANLGLLGHRLRSFLGDSGARLIGFMAAIVLIYAAKMNYIDPVMAYFPMAVPVCDCLILMAVRVMDKRSPLSADRLHLHHLLTDCGLSTGATRHTILGIAVLLSVIGFSLQYYNVTEWVVSIVVVVSFWSFIGLRWTLRKLATQSSEVAAG